MAQWGVSKHLREDKFKDRDVQALSGWPGTSLGFLQPIGSFHADLTPEPVPSAHTSLRAKLLPSVLSITAGSVDAIGFLGLGGLLTAHITGNLVIIAVDLVSGEHIRLASMLSVPIFMLALAFAGLLAGGLDRIGFASLRPLLLVQFILLAGLLLACIAAGPQMDLNSPRAIIAGMLGVSAMAVQNALVQTSLEGTPPTAAMTTNVTRFMLDVAEILLGRGNDSADARRRARRTWPAIVSFAAGGGLGAAAECRFGLWSLALPAGLALLAFGLALTAISVADGFHQDHRSAAR
ncbi:MAG: hypothetical protein JWM91_1197 [Rhodospirillales bacterium]|nr:hypothetical protein [Rhodospirillales bacterium]